MSSEKKKNVRKQSVSSEKTGVQVASNQATSKVEVGLDEKNIHNLKALRQSDPYISEIMFSATHVVLYVRVQEKWVTVKDDHEHMFPVVSRKVRKLKDHCM